MKKTICLLLILLSAICCKSQPESFDFIIRGTIKGLDKSELFLSLSPRLDDEVKIPVTNNTFEYSGSATNLYTSYFLIDRNFKKGSFHIVVEPGEIANEQPK